MSMIPSDEEILNALGAGRTMGSLLAELNLSYDRRHAVRWALLRLYKCGQVRMASDNVWCKEIESVQSNKTEAQNEPSL